MALGALTEAGPALIKQYVTNKLLDKGIAGIERFTGTSSDDGDKDKGTGFVSQQKPGGLGSIIGRALAFSLLGPILGPLAFDGGKGILNLSRQKGLSFNPFGGDGDDGPIGPGGINLVELEKGIQSTLDDTDPADIGLVDAATANIQDYADIMPEDSGSDSGGSFDGASSMEEYSSDPTGYSGSFRYGGLASLYR